MWQESEYVSYNTQCMLTVQANEYLLRDGCIQNHFEDIRQNTLEKQLQLLTIFA